MGSRLRGCHRCNYAFYFLDLAHAVGDIVDEGKERVLSSESLLQLVGEHGVGGFGLFELFLVATRCEGEHCKMRLSLQGLF